MCEIKDAPTSAGSHAGMRTRSAASLAALALALALPAPARAATPPALAAAIAATRRVQVDDLPEKEREARIQRFTEGQRALVLAREEGIRAIEEELSRLRAAGETDALFQSIAAEIIVAVREAAGFPAAAAALRGVDPRTDLRHLWPTLSAAAASQDPRALPLLRMALDTDLASAPTRFPDHAMDVPWPYTLVFLYGAFGRGACDDLLALAAGPRSPRVDESVAIVLPRLACPGAAAPLRRWIDGGEPRRVAAALRALGELGDPADAPLLARFARAADVEVRRACAYGLWELSVPATAPAVRALLGDSDEPARREALTVAFRLPDDETLAAVVARRRAADGDEAARIDEWLAAMARGGGVTREALAQGDAAARRKVVAAYWDRSDRELERRAGDPALSRAELEAALARWEKGGRVQGAGPGLARAVLAVARPADVEALLRVRGRVLLRQSDECFPEVQWLDGLLRVLQRRALGHPKPYA